MATKNNPGTFDCYGNAAPDEPLFTFRPTCEMSPLFVKLYAHLRAKELSAVYETLNTLVDIALRKSPPDPAKIAEAHALAAQMEAWRAKHA